MAFVKVMNKGELKSGEGKVVEANGKKLALFNVDGNYHAIDNACPHKDGPLGEGMIDGKTVACPWHGWVFDVETGVSPVNPAAKVARYDVKIEGEDVLVDL